MRIPGRDILLVGQGFHNVEAWTDLLRGWGFRCHFASTVRTAREVLGSVRVDIVLASTNLPDGTGFGLVADLSGFPVTAFLCLPVEDSCFWVPAVDVGSLCLGLPAMRPEEFASALKEMARCLSSEAEIIPVAPLAMAL